MGVRSDDPCPCGGGLYGACCLPLHAGERHAETAEQLMRSRYSAFAAGDGEYLWRSWHPRTRPHNVGIETDVVWTGLDIIDCVAGGPETIGVRSSSWRPTGKTNEEGRCMSGPASL